MEIVREKCLCVAIVSGKRTTLMMSTFVDLPLSMIGMKRFKMSTARKLKGSIYSSEVDTKQEEAHAFEWLQRKLALALKRGCIKIGRNTYYISKQRMSEAQQHKPVMNDN